MAILRETLLKRLAAAEGVFYGNLVNIKGVLESNGIVWHPPSGGDDYWKKGLRYQLTEEKRLRYRLPHGITSACYRDLDTDDLRAMMEKFDAFVEFVQQQHGLDIEPQDRVGGSESDYCLGIRLLDDLTLEMPWHRTWDKT